MHHNWPKCVFHGCTSKLAAGYRKFCLIHNMSCETHHNTTKYLSIMSPLSVEHDTDYSLVVIFTPQSFAAPTINAGSILKPSSHNSACFDSSVCLFICTAQPFVLWCFFKLFPSEISNVCFLCLVTFMSDSVNPYFILTTVPVVMSPLKYFFMALLSYITCILVGCLVRGCIFSSTDATE